MNPYEACSDKVQDRLAQQRLGRIEAGAGRVVLYNPKVGLIETYRDRGWWVQGGNTRVRATDKVGAERLAQRWDRTGNCPVPDSTRITPKRGRAV